ncbi:putative dehydrogenase [Abditibacterium utsteinense]|uniref:Putative dehydrogenase n=1 Tax=Abditibacterium utsteinense TaxID=1960156 RepID=A0A2S8SS96_9BACT|nr:Gfo/Idh/MocA family oxidoreductase [Abditibacterium utsteinense]PQV63609.1 putative dehydrogenase [Abditibacterium utsteinense]
MKTIRWGIIGCGDVCEIKSGPALQLANNSALVAVMRRDAKKAADFAARHNVPFWTDVAQKIIDNPEVDAVYIATPPETHLEYALRICAAKKPCYVEKPMARSVRESQIMLDAFQNAGVPLYVAFYRRGLERFQTTKHLLESGAIGTLTSVNYRLFIPRTDDPNQWRLSAQMAGAGLFYDLASHLLDVFDYLFGPLQNVAGIAKNLATPEIEVEDNVAMSFLAAGVPAAASWNFASWSRADRIEIFGTQGKISLSCFGSDDVRLESSSGLKTFNGKLPPHVHQGLVQTVVDELNGQGRALSTGESALRTMRVMDTVLSDYYGGRDDDFWNRSNTWPGRR